MEILRTESDLNKYIHSQKIQGKRIGFSPTMGALHEGHFQLIRKSREENDTSVCSIFVNPTQFNDPTDLDKYPRTEKEDCEGLAINGCDMVWIPQVQEVYPNGIQKSERIDLEGLDLSMEGLHRPGHFQGVVQVVKRLLDLFQCDRLYMGQKDYQQFTIVRHMIRRLDLSVELRIVETMREKDGLAMSSRNRRLRPEHRDRASVIYRMLCQARDWLPEKSIAEIESKAMEYLSIPGFRPEYFQIVDGMTLQRIDHLQSVDLAVACTAVWAGEIRLIDNMILHKKNE